MYRSAISHIIFSTRIYAYLSAKSLKRSMIKAIVLKVGAKIRGIMNIEQGRLNFERTRNAEFDFGILRPSIFHVRYSSFFSPSTKKGKE